MTESNEQFHYSRSLEANLVRYMWGTRLFRDRVSLESACESTYLESLGNLHEMVTKLEPDPHKADAIIRDVLPPRFEDSGDADENLWVTRLRLVPAKLIQRGDITIDREDVSPEFFEELLQWVIAYGEGHDARCAGKEACQHQLASHRELCPVRITGKTLVDEIDILYYKMHSEYTTHSLANRLQFMHDRIETIGDMFVKCNIGSRDEVDAFLLRLEDRAITDASKVNGWDFLAE